MTTTTSYGTWVNHGDTTNLTVEATVADAIAGGDADWRERVESTGAFDSMVTAYRDAINDALPEGVFLTGDEFIGPYFTTDCDFDRDELNLAEIIEGVDLFAIVEKFDPDNQ
jgi:hypothetical protein